MLQWGFLKKAGQPNPVHLLSHSFPQLLCFFTSRATKLFTITITTITTTTTTMVLTIITTYIIIVTKKKGGCYNA